MATIKLAGYGSLSASLVSLTTGVATGTSSEIDNSSDLYRWDDLEIVIKFSAGTAAGRFISIDIVQSVDGTNYEDTDNLLPVANIGIDNGTSTQRIVVRRIPIPAGKFKYRITLDDYSANLEASGNTFKRRPYGIQVSL